MTSFPHAVTWFEIPVADFDRACAFYETVLGVTLKREICDLGGNPIAILPHGEGAVGGCLSGSGAGGAAVASTRDGTTLYLRLAGDLDAALARATAAGGALLVPVSVLPGAMGRYAVIADCEGNRIGLHQFATDAAAA